MMMLLERLGTLGKAAGWAALLTLFPLVIGIALSGCSGAAPSNSIAASAGPGGQEEESAGRPRVQIKSDQRGERRAGPRRARADRPKAGKKEASETTAGRGGSSAGASVPPPEQPKAAIPIPAAPPQPPHKPIVAMSDAHAATCLVKVGDRMPDLSLPDLEGHQRSLAELYGDRLTIVVFWNRQYVFALEQYLRLGRETVDRFSAFGVSVVAINVGDELATVQAISEKAGARVPCLLDRQGEAMRQVGVGKLPRSYVLDAEGQILWLDIEYSLSTARELRNAVYYFLRRLGGGEEDVPVGRRAAPPMDKLLCVAVGRTSKSTGGLADWAPSRRGPGAPGPAEVGEPNCLRRLK